MRITTQMLNNMAQKSGVAVNQCSLLDYLDDDDSSTGSLLSALQSQDSKAVSTESYKKYEKQETAAEALTTQIQKFTQSGEDSIWQKAEESGSTSDICTEVKTLADKYNSLLSVMGTSTNTLDMFYTSSLKELPEDSSDELSAIGITIKSDGSLSVDEEKLSAASVDELKKALGADSEFVQHLTYLTGKIGDNAESNLESITSSYSSVGSLTSSYTSKYDLWG